MLNSKSRTIYIPERMFVWENKIENQEEKRRLEQKAIQNGTAKKNKKSHLFRDSSAILFYHIRGGVCEISVVKRLSRT